MKKMMIMALTALSILGAGAQELQEPNRMIVAPKAGSQKSYAIDNIDQLAFRRVEGEVVAEVKILNIADQIGAKVPVTVSVMKSEACDYFKFALVPAAVISMYDDAATAAYVDMTETTEYYNDFTNGDISGITLDPATNYAVVTAAYDKFGTLCHSSKAIFTSPSVPLVGNPKVDCEVTNVGKYSFSVKFTPNADVAGYACVQFSSAEDFDAQFNMFAGMMGFANYGQMVESWGIKETKEVTKTWSEDIGPGNDYLVAVQCWDVNHTYAPLIYVYVTTNPQGGEGVAACDVEFGDYEKEVDNSGKASYWQTISFGINDQTWRYRVGVYTKEMVDEYGMEAIREAVQSYPENFMQEPKWWQYDDLTTQYPLEPNTEFVVVTCAQNAKSEWCEIKEFWHTTPADAAPASAVPARVAVSSDSKLPGISASQRSEVKINKDIVPVRNLRLTEAR